MATVSMFDISFIHYLNTLNNNRGHPGHAKERPTMWNFRPNYIDRSIAIQLETRNLKSLYQFPLIFC